MCTDSVDAASRVSPPSGARRTSVSPMPATAAAGRFALERGKSLDQRAGPRAKRRQVNRAGSRPDERGADAYRRRARVEPLGDVLRGDTAGRQEPRMGKRGQHRPDVARPAGLRGKDLDQLRTVIERLEHLRWRERAG